jgi:hypothetical protein
MSLTWRERRALRGIERMLTAEDPSLAGRLNRPPAPAARATVLDRIASSYFWASILLLAYGFFLGDADLVRGAMLLLGVFPPLVLLLAAAFRCDRCDQGVGRWPPE